jgi:hypothetical protein
MGFGLFLEDERERLGRGGGPHWGGWVGRVLGGRWAGLRCAVTHLEEE